MHAILWLLLIGLIECATIRSNERSAMVSGGPKPNPGRFMWKIPPNLDFRTTCILLVHKLHPELYDQLSVDYGREPEDAFYLSATQAAGEVSERALYFGGFVAVDLVSGSSWHEHPVLCCLHVLELLLSNWKKPPV